MTYATYKIPLDLHKTGSQISLRMKVGDTARRVYFRLAENGATYHIAEGTTARFRALKPDTTKLFYDCELRDNEFVFEGTEQLTAAAGLLECELNLYGSDGKLISSPTFAIVVEENVYDDSEIESEDDFASLVAALTAADNIDIDVSKEGRTVTLTITTREGIEESVEIYDGTGVYFSDNGIVPHAMVRGQIGFYIDDLFTDDRTIMDNDIIICPANSNTYVVGNVTDTEVEVDYLTRVSDKQDKLSADQLAAVNSGITAEKVEEIAGKYENRRPASRRPTLHPQCRPRSARRTRRIKSRLEVSLRQTLQAESYRRHLRNSPKTQRTVQLRTRKRQAGMIRSNMQ